MIAICQNERAATEAINFRAALTNPARKEQGMATSHRRCSTTHRQVACKKCGAAFLRKPKTRTDYCSDACRAAVRRESGRAYLLAPHTKQKSLARAGAYYATNGERVRARLKHRYKTDADFRHRCKQRSIDSRKARKEADPVAYRVSWRDKHLRKTYRITHKEYLQLLADQGGKCAICGATERIPGKGGTLAVDHDHDTHKVRGLLCMLCNRGIGAFRDNAAFLSSAAKYLRRTNHVIK